jgi:PIN domain nuclease of toxin-antitoxin system
LAKSKPPSLLLDTHIWLRYLGVSGNLRPSSIPVIEDAAATDTLYISAITIWEIALLVRLEKLRLQPNVSMWIREALDKPGIHLLPLSPEIAIDSVNLPEPMHKDPADRILVASARIENLTLVTRDKKILAFAEATKLNYIQA